MDLEALTYALESIMSAQKALEEGMYDLCDQKMAEAKKWIEQARG